MKVCRNGFPHSDDGHINECSRFDKYYKVSPETKQNHDVIQPFHCCVCTGHAGYLLNIMASDELGM